MQSGRRFLCGVGFGVVISTAVAVAQSGVLVGRWDLDVHRAAGQQPSWMEVTMQSGKPHVSFVGSVGDAADAVQAEMRNGELDFVVLKDPNEGKEFDVQYKVHFVNGRLTGSLRGTDGSTATFTGVRAPALPDRAGVVWGQASQALQRERPEWMALQRHQPLELDRAGWDAAQRRPRRGIDFRRQVPGFQTAP